MGRLGEMVGDEDRLVGGSGLEMLKACDASERAPHMGRNGEMLGDEDRGVRRSVVEVLKACGATDLASAARAAARCDICWATKVLLCAGRWWRC